jgi:hypothetical protein
LLAVSRDENGKTVSAGHAWSSSGHYVHGQIHVQYVVSRRYQRSAGRGNLEERKATLKSKTFTWLVSQHRIWTSNRRARHELQAHSFAFKSSKTQPSTCRCNVFLCEEGLVPVRAAREARCHLRGTLRNEAHSELWTENGSMVLSVLSTQQPGSPAVWTCGG